MIPERTSTMDVPIARRTWASVRPFFNARVQAASLKKLGPVKLFPRVDLRTTSPHCNSDPQMTWRSHLYANISRVDRPIAESASRPQSKRRRSQRLTRGVEREGAQLHFATERGRIKCRGGIARGVRSPAVLVADRAPRDAVGDPLARSRTSWMKALTSARSSSIRVVTRHSIFSDALT